MSRLHPVRARQLIRYLEYLGFIQVRQQGSHVRYQGAFNGETRNVTFVAGQRQVPPKTLASIGRQLGLSSDQFRRLLSS